MDRYSIRSLDDLVVPNYHESSSSPDLWEGWAISSPEATEKGFMSSDYDMINNGFNGDMYHSSSLHDFNGIQHMDDIFLTSILEDIPDVNLHSFAEPSAEELVLQDLQRATENFTDETRKCFRNTFYRLAEKSQDSQHKSDSRRSTRRKTELETNSIDRVIANLTFNKMESNLVKFPSPEGLASIH